MISTTISNADSEICTSRCVYALQDESLKFCTRCILVMAEAEYLLYTVLCYKGFGYST